ARPAGRVFRLPVDRSFSIKGFGTVVTGTMTSGRVAVGDEVEILPGGARVRVRGLEVFGDSCRDAAAGQRTAGNLQGVETSAVIDNPPRKLAAAGIPPARQRWESLESPDPGARLRETIRGAGRGGLLLGALRARSGLEPPAILEALEKDLALGEILRLPGEPP